jgi:hypothetical protein
MTSRRRSTRGVGGRRKSPEQADSEPPQSATTTLGSAAQGDEIAVDNSAGLPVTKPFAN